MRRRVLALAVACAALVACSPPESTRRRGEPGADVGNRGENLVLHERRDPFHATPRRGARP